MYVTQILNGFNVSILVYCSLRQHVYILFNCANDKQPFKSSTITAHKTATWKFNVHVV